MKNKFITIFVMIVVLFISCSDGGNGDGQVTGLEEVTVTNQQVYTGSLNAQTGNVTWTAFSGSMSFLQGSYGRAVITNGKLNLTLGTPETDELQAFGNFGGYSDHYENFSLSAPDVNITGFYEFIMGNYNLNRGTYSMANFSVSNGNNSGVETLERVEFLYVDKDVTIKGTGKITKYDNDIITTNNINLPLKKGWNMIRFIGVNTFTYNFATETRNNNETRSRIIGNPGNYRWFLDQYNN